MTADELQQHNRSIYVDVEMTYWYGPPPLGLKQEIIEVGLVEMDHHFGVPDKTIQAILRHSNVAVTEACYIKTISSDTVEALRSLDIAARAQGKEH